MTDTVHLIEREIGPGGKEVDYHGDISVKANKVVKDYPIRKWTMNYGPFSNLRNNLVEI